MSTQSKRELRQIAGRLLGEREPHERMAFLAYREELKANGVTERDWLAADEEVRQSFRARAVPPPSEGTPAGE